MSFRVGFFSYQFAQWMVQVFVHMSNIAALLLLPIIHLHGLL